MERRVWLAALLAAALLGCEKQAGSGGAAAAGPEDLKRLGIAFHAFSAKNPGQPVAESADLKPFMGKEADDRQAFKQLQAGNIIFCWGVSLKELTEASKVRETVLAYVQQAPEEGGWVVMGDARVKQMSKKEFADAPLGKPKK